jgi:hypothetical protein
MSIYLSSDGVPYPTLGIQKYFAVLLETSSFAALDELENRNKRTCFVLS